MKKPVFLFSAVLICLILFTALLLSISGCSKDETVTQPPPPPPPPTAWETSAPMPTARWGHSACIVDGKIYVFGGSFGTTWNSEATDILEVYDPSNDSWDTNKSPMPTGRIRMSIAVINGKVYTIGGRARWGRSPIGNVEVYDIATDSWDVTKKPMPKPRAGAGGCVVNSKIYIAGGSTGDGGNFSPQNDLQIYDPITDNWDITKSAMSSERMGVKACVLGESIYVIGGTGYDPWAGKNTVEIYNPTTDTWEIKATLNEGRKAHSLNIFDGKIYVFGGASSGSTQVRSVEVYDPAADSWKIIEETPIWYTKHSSSVFQGKMYLMGGSVTGSVQGNYTPSASVYSFDPSLIEEE
jgi:N-acetylneuraminic acid mutarotase